MLWWTITSTSTFSGLSRAVSFRNSTTRLLATKGSYRYLCRPGIERRSESIFRLFRKSSASDRQQEPVKFHTLTTHLLDGASGMIRKRTMTILGNLGRLLAVALLVSLPPAITNAASPKKIVLIAGPLDSHPCETHEYEKNVILLKHCLDTSPDLKGVTVEAHFNGWPANPATLDDAATILLTSGGSDRKETDHPLYVGERFDQLARQMRRGCGLVLFHWSTFNPRRVHEQITEWVGGYFDYESGSTPNKWFSAILTREWTTAVATPDHPVARGVKPFKVTEEF